MGVGRGRPRKGMEGIGRGLKSEGRPRCRFGCRFLWNRRVEASRGCKTFEEMKVSNALELVPWAIDFDSRATLAGSSRTGPRYQRPLYREQALVDCAAAAPRRPAPQCAVHREKAVQRLLEVSATSPSACGPLVAGRMDDDLGIAVRTLLCLRSSFSCCLGRHLCVIAAS